jgi:hypothetical protein
MFHHGIFLTKAGCRSEALLKTGAVHLRCSAGDICCRGAHTDRKNSIVKQTASRPFCAAAAAALQDLCLSCSGIVLGEGGRCIMTALQQYRVRAMLVDHLQVGWLVGIEAQHTQCDNTAESRCCLALTIGRQQDTTGTGPIIRRSCQQLENADPASRGRTHKQNRQSGQQAIRPTGNQANRQSGQQAIRPTGNQANRPTGRPLVSQAQLAQMHKGKLRSWGPAAVE